MKAFFTAIILFIGTCFWGFSQGAQNKLDSLQQYIPTNLKLADSLGQNYLYQTESGELDLSLSKLNYTLGLINYYLGRYQLSSKYYNDALEHLQEGEDPELEASIWNNLGINYEFSNDFEKAIDSYLKSLDYALAKKDSFSIYQSYLNLGLIYTRLTDYSQSEKYLQQAYDYFSKEDDLLNSALALQNLGILYRSAKNDSAARDYFQRAIALIEQTDNTQGLASLYNDYMYYLLTINDFQAFENGLPKFEAITQQVDNDYLAASVKVTMGNYHYSAKKNYSLAIKFYTDALHALQEYEAVPQLSIVYPNLIDCYLQSGNKFVVTEYLKKYDTFLTTYYAAESAEKIAELRAVHEVAQKEAEAQLLVEKLKQKNRVLLFSFAVGGLFLIISLVTAYFLWMLRKKDKALVARSIEINNLVAQDSFRHAPFISQVNISQNSTQMYELFGRIKQFIVTQEKFLDPNLKLSDVAQALGTNEKYISQATFLGSNMRFNAFVNFYRINRAKQLLQSDLHKQYSIGDVARNSGFSHQTTFQGKFKEQTGVTPFTFQRLASLNKEKDSASEE